MCAVPSAPGAPGIRVWAIMSWRWGHEGGDRPPQGVDVGYPLFTGTVVEKAAAAVLARPPARTRAS
jgi:hypothetical protein